jgi:hypothetical protein
MLNMIEIETSIKKVIHGHFRPDRFLKPVRSEVIMNNSFELFGALEMDSHFRGNDKVYK